MRRAVLLACALAGVVLAQDAEGLRLRLEAFFAAKDEDARKKAEDALEGVPVPHDLAGRVQALRRALPLAARKGASRIDEKLAAADAFFVTPKGYDPKKAVPVVLSLHGRGGDGHHGLQPFALPEEEWDEIKKPLEEDAKKRAPEGAKITIRRPNPKVPYEDGLVVAPSYMKQDLDGDVAEEVVLEALERLNRSYAGDPDKVVLGGISMGGAAACLVAERHPDRFSGVLAVAGYDPNFAGNLKPLQVYLVQGVKDDHVPVEAGRQMDAMLKEASVTHVYRELAALGHQWPDPEEGAKIRAWMRERTRQPWPREFSHRFGPWKRARRCFWVEVPGPGAVVSAKAKENEIDLDVQGAASIVLHLGEPLVDLEKEVVVRWGQTEVFRGKLARSWKELLADVEATGFDLPRAAPARLEVKAP